MSACHYCRQPVDPDATSTYRRVSGWERKSRAASRRSGSDITLREQVDQFACDDCVRRLKRGLSPSQGSLI